MALKKRKGWTLEFHPKIKIVQMCCSSTLKTCMLRMFRDYREQIILLSGQFSLPYLSKDMLRKPFFRSPWSPYQWMWRVFKLMKIKQTFFVFQRLDKLAVSVGRQKGVFGKGLLPGWSKIMMIILSPLKNMCRTSFENKCHNMVCNSTLISNNLQY